jgi:two-component system LytT family response regulator
MEKKISLIIVDDEPNALEVLKAILGQVQGVEVLGIFLQARTALNYLIENPNNVDLVLLDIEMPEMNGLEFCKILNHYTHSPCVVFVTGHSHFAIEALRTQAFDFLLKPVAREDITSMLQRYKLRCFHQQRSGNNHTNTEKSPPEKIIFSHQRGIFAYHPDAIFYIAADGNYSQLALTSGKKQLVTMQIGQIEKLIDSRCFFRINRSTLINLKYFEYANQKERTCTVIYNGFSENFNISLKKIREMQDLFLGKN